MKNQNFKMNSEDVGKTIVIREGAAEKLFDPRQVSVEGNIKAPVEFYKKRKSVEGIKPTDMHVTFNKDKGTIVLVYNEDDHFAKLISGSLKLNPELERFDINGKVELELDELVKLLKFNKPFFKNAAEHERIMKDLRDFNVKVEKNVSDKNDDRGNIERAFVQKVNHGKDFTFTATRSIFVGFEPVDFKVEIVCEFRSGVSFWFESIEFEELIQKTKEQIMNNELAELTEIVCIEQ